MKPLTPALVATSLGLLLVATPSSAQKRNQKTQYPVSLPDQSITVNGGTLDFRELRVTRCDETGFGVVANEYLQGAVTNNSPHNWRYLWVNMVARDTSGRETNIDHIMLENFRTGSSAKLGWQKCGISLTLLPRNLASWGFVMDHATMETAFDIALIRPTSNDALQFQDERISIEFRQSRAAMEFALQNHTTSVMRIDWNQVAFVDWSGKSQQVIHQGVKFIDKAASKPPSVIPPGTRLEDMILPTDSVTMGSRDWVVRDFFPLSGPEADQLKNREYSILLPITVADKTTDYYFTFKIRAVHY
jgi:hypothetical protein